MAPAGIERGLFNDIRRVVCRDGHALQESPRAGIDGVDDQAIERSAGKAGIDHRGGLDRHAQPDLLTEVLHEPDLPAAGVIEAVDIIGLDRQRNVLLSGGDTDGVLGEQTPRLAGKKVEAPVGVVIGHVGVPHAHRPAVGLGVVR